jgi:hypothetical protein
MNEALDRQRYFPARRAMLRVDRLIKEGAIAGAADLLEKIYRFTFKARLLMMTTEIGETLAGLTKEQRPERAIRVMDEVCEIHETVRGRFTSPEHRMDYAAFVASLHAELIALAASSSNMTDGGDGPKLALKAMERAKSRSLADQFGTTVPVPPVDGIGQAVAAAVEEHRALDAFEEWERQDEEAGRYFMFHEGSANSAVRRDEERARLHDAWQKAKTDADEALSAFDDDYARWRLAQEFIAAAKAEQTVATLQTRLHKPGLRTVALRKLPAARLRLERAWNELFQQGGAAAEYVALRRGDVLDFSQIKALL